MDAEYLIIYQYFRGLLALLPFCDMHFLFFQDLILEINELRYRLTELESEKLQYEKKLKSTKVSCCRDVHTFAHSLCVYLANSSRLTSYSFLAVYVSSGLVLSNLSCSQNTVIKNDLLCHQRFQLTSLTHLVSQSFSYKSADTITCQLFSSCKNLQNKIFTLVS